jgi:pimeloyl-ACP methyl ester carboxylesterase
MTTGAEIEQHHERVVEVLCQRIRTSVRAGTGVPLVLCNGIGASLDLLDPLVEHLDRDIPVVRFDPPGSPNSPLPYGLPYLAHVLGQVLDPLISGFLSGGQRPARRMQRRNKEAG